MQLPPNKNGRSKNTQGASKLGTLLILLAWLIGLRLVIHNHQAIWDWWKLRNYQAPANIAQLADQDTMTQLARKDFYVNQPAVLNKADFSTKCPNLGGEKANVLGCYRSGQNGIYLLAVSDPRLNGVEQVTAAHEMLHAAYDRLSSKDRDQVNTMLLDYYKNQLNDQLVKQQIDAYKSFESDSLVNEMHSILGTEIANLPAPLEKYYSRYFSNRPQIASFYGQYQAAFTTRQNLINQMRSELDTLKSQIDANRADLDNKQVSLKQQRDELSALQSSGDTNDYNARVDGYNSLVSAYNAEARTTQNLIDQYNSLLDNYKSLVFEENQLYQELSGVNQLGQ